MIVVERDRPNGGRGARGFGIIETLGKKTGHDMRLVGPVTSFEHSAFWNELGEAHSVRVVTDNRAEIGLGAPSCSAPRFMKIASPPTRRE